MAGNYYDFDSYAEESYCDDVSYYFDTFSVYNIAEYNGTDMIPYTSNVFKQYLDYFQSNYTMLYYYRNSTGDIINLGQYALLIATPSVYPDHVEVQLGEELIIDFTLEYNYFNYESYKVEIDSDVYDEYISFSFD